MWVSNLKLTSILVMFVILGAIGVSTAYAITITLGADPVNVLGNLNVDGNLDVTGTITGDVSGVTLAGDTLITQNVGTQPILELKTTPAATAPPFLVTDSASNELFKVNQDGSIQIGSNSVVIGADGTVTGPLKLPPGSTVGGVDIIVLFDNVDEKLLVFTEQVNAAIDGVIEQINGVATVLEDDFVDLAIVLNNEIDDMDSRVTLLELGGLTPATFYENSETFVNVPLDLVNFFTILAVQCDAGDTVTGGGATNNIPIFAPEFGFPGDIFNDGPFPSDGTRIGWEAGITAGCENIPCTINAPNSFTLTVFCADTALPAHSP